MLFAAFVAFYCIQESRPAVETTSEAKEKLLIVEMGPGSAQFHKSALRLSKLRGAPVEKIDDTENLQFFRDAVARSGAGAVAIFVAPETLDINFNRKIYDSICKIDADPFPDATIGYFTGARPEDVEEMLNSMERVERDGLADRRVHVGVATLEQYTKYEKYGDTAGADFSGLFLPVVEKNKDPRGALPALYKDTENCGIITFSGNGDPMRAWLFGGDRNRHRELHWPYEPEKIFRKFNDPEMPAFGAADLNSWNVKNTVLWFSTCHSGVPRRAMVGGDIVSTFGDPARKVYFYNLKPEESFCLSLLARGPASLVAPIGPNHGFSNDVELSRAIGENLSIGEAIRRNWIDLVLTYREKGGFPLTLQFDGKAEAMPPGPGSIMREGTANRIVYGDPTFAPFVNIKNRRPTLDVKLYTNEKGADGIVSIAVQDPSSGEAWDPYHGPERMERINARFEVPAGFVGIESLVFDGAAPQIYGDWILELRPGRAPSVWFSIFTKAPKEYTKRALWLAGAKYYLNVKFTKDPAKARPSSEVESAKR